MRLVTFSMLLFVAAAGAYAAGGAPSASENDALVLAINNWNDDCSGNWRPWKGMLNDWYYDITDDRATSGHGSSAWDEDGLYKDGNIQDKYFCDTDTVSWGTDILDDHADEPDALMVGLHGGHYLGDPTGHDWWLGTPRVTNGCGAGDDGCNCAISQAHMRLGDYDLEFLHLSSCHSMCKKNWYVDSGETIADEEWYVSFDGLHQANGFHGIMYISSTYSRYGDFSKDAFGMPISDSWIDNQYDSGFWTGDESCPVTIAAGKSPTSASTRISNEEFDFVYDDPDNPSAFAIMWISGCDPDEHPALP